MKSGDTRTALEKIRVPDVGADYLPRTRLARRLDRGTCTPITHVCAPSGFGKTSLVAHWARETEEPVAWLRVDEGDGDVGVFARHLLAAVRAVAPKTGAQTAGLLRKRRPIDASRYGAALAADLGSLAGALVLVLDDVSAVPTSATHELLDELLRRLPAANRLILLSRFDPPLALQQLLVAGRASEVRQGELAFDAEETAAYLKQQTGWVPEAEQLARLADRLAGWPTGLRLLALGLSDPENRDQVLEHLPEGVRQARRYLCTELFDRNTPEDQRRLLQCSILREFTPELCAAVAGSEGADARPSGFPVSEGTFVTRIEGRRSWYRFGSLYRDFLDDCRRERFDADAVKACHDRAARWLSDHGHLGAAIDHALQGRTPNSAAGILAEHRMRLVDEGRYPELFATMGRLPEAVVDSHLDTRFLRVWVTLPEVFHEAAATLEASLADEDLPAERVDALRGELRLVQTGNFMALSLEDPSGLPELAARAEEALELLPVEFRGARAMAYYFLAQILQFSGDPAATDAVLDRALAELAVAGGHPLSVVLHGRALVDFLEGNLVRVRDAAQRALACELLVPPETEAFRQQVRRLLGLAHYQWNELEVAEQALNHPEARTYPESLQALAHVRQAQGRESEARSLMEEALAHVSEGADSTVLVFARAQEALLALQQGRTESALRWAEGTKTEDIRPFHSALGITMIRARILVELGAARHRETASTLLDLMERTAAQVHARSKRLEILALRALLRAAEGDEDAAFADLRESLALASGGGYLRVYLDLGPAMRSLLARLPVPRGYEDYVSTLRTEFAHLRLRAAERAKQDLPAPLTDRELEVLGLMADRLSNKEIAGRLYVSLATVKTHAINIYQKLHVNDRREAVERAVGLGLLPDPDRPHLDRTR